MKRNFTGLTPEEILTSEIGTYSYYVSLVRVVLERLCVTAFVFSVFVGQFIRVQQVDLEQAFFMALREYWYLISFDLVWMFISIKAFKHNPKDLSLEYLMTTDSWEHMKYRRVNYFLFSLIPLVVILLGIMSYSNNFNI